MIRLFARITCWLKGHDDHRECDAHARTFRLRCANCGRGTVGWTIDGNEPVVREHGDQMRHVPLQSAIDAQAEAWRSGVVAWRSSAERRIGP